MDFVLGDAEWCWAHWVCSRLASPDIDLRVARDGARLDALVRDGPPRVVMLDWRLPGLEPFGWIGQLSALRQRSPLAVIVSALPGDERALSLARLAGATAVVRKGLDGPLLQRVVAACLPARAAAPAADAAPPAFELPPLIADPASARRAVVVFDFISSLPAESARLRELAHAEPARAEAVLSAFAARCHAAGALALGLAAAELAQRAALELVTGPRDLDRLLERVAEATETMTRWLLQQQRRLGEAAVPPAAAAGRVRRRPRVSPGRSQ